MVIFQFPSLIAAVARGSPGLRCASGDFYNYVCTVRLYNPLKSEFLLFVRLNERDRQTKRCRPV